MKGSLVLLAVALLSLGGSSCGGAGKGSSSTVRSTASGAVRRSSSSSSSAPDASARAIPPLRFLGGDYDNDDYERRSNDADNDDLPKPRDVDNDADHGKGGHFDADDRAVLGFGRAASPADRRAIAALVERYYRVAAARDGARGCAMIVASLSKSLPEVLGGPAGLSYLSGKTCAQVLTKVFRQNHRQMAVFATGLRVSAVRMRGREAIVVMTFRRLPARQLRVVREDGAWKIGALLDAELS
jgi:hypothetical protein